MRESHGSRITSTRDQLRSLTTTLSASCRSGLNMGSTAISMGGPRTFAALPVVGQRHPRARQASGIAHQRFQRVGSPQVALHGSSSRPRFQRGRWPGSTCAGRLSTRRFASRRQPPWGCAPLSSSASLAGTTIQQGASPTGHQPAWAVAFIPSVVRALMRSRSHSAIESMKFRWRRPSGVSSMCSVIETNLTPRSSSSPIKQHRDGSSSGRSLLDDHGVDHRPGSLPSAGQIGLLAYLPEHHRPRRIHLWHPSPDPRRTARPSRSGSKSTSRAPVRRSTPGRRSPPGPLPSGLVLSS